MISSLCLQRFALFQRSKPCPWRHRGASAVTPALPLVSRPHLSVWVIISPTLNEATVSRGIGTRQRLFLAAMAKLEQECGEAGAYVWQIINAAGELGLTDEASARKARRKEASRQAVLEIEVLAAAGDKH